MVPEKPPKINLFALPSQTSLLFFIIAVTLGIPVLLSGSSASFFLLPVLPAGVALLTLWDFLRQPDVQRRRWRMGALPEEHGWLGGWIEHLAQDVGLKQSPQILVAHAGLGAPFAFGTWRRHYLAFPSWLLPEMATAARRSHSDDPAVVEAVLRHELAHFVNQDVWLASLARSFLKMTVVFLAANWFAMLWLPFTYELLRQMVADWSSFFPTALLSLFPADIQQFFSQPPALTGADIFVMETMFSIALWPLIFGALLLWRMTWNSMLQVREQVADARVASWLHSAAPVGRAIKWFAIVQATTFVEDSARPFWARALDRLQKTPASQRTAPPLAWAGAGVGRRWFSPQPSPQSRYETMARPERVYGAADEVGRRAGLSVLLLYLLMASIFAPTGTGVNSEIAIGFGFIILALGLTPTALINGHDRRFWMRQIARAVVIYSLFFGIIIMTMFVIAAFVVAWQPRSLDLTLYAIAMVAPRGNLAVVVDDPTGWLVQAFLGALLTFGLGLPILVFSFVVADLSLKQHALTWYAAPLLQRRSRLFLLGITTVGALVLWLGALPLLNLVAFPTVFETDDGFWLRLAIAALIVVMSGVGFFVMHARYAHRCPQCGSKVTDAYALGKRCQECGVVLNPWLIAGY